MFEELIEIEEIGFEETYDLEIDSEYHNFYANDICVSNSHSVSYAYIAMQTLYLKHYYPTYFYTALLNEPKSSGGKEKEEQWLTQTITAAMSKGIVVQPPTKKSSWKWSMTGPNEITMGFSSINKMGDVAYEELMNALKVKGKKFHEIALGTFFDIKFSKFNKTAFDACLKAGVFDDWSTSREYMQALRLKAQKRKPKSKEQFSLFDLDEMEYTHKLDPMKYPITTEEEKRSQFIEVCGVDMQEIQRISKIHINMEELNKKSKEPILPLPHYTEEGFYWFIIQDILYKKTKKNKEFVCIVAGDGIDTVRFNVFPPTSEKILPELQRQAVYVGHFKMNEQGYLNYNGRIKLKTVMYAYEDTLLV